MSDTANTAATRNRTLAKSLTLTALAVLVLAAGFAVNPARAEAAGDIELFDTAWDLPYFANLNEVDVYFDHLADSGYTGVWISLLNHTSGLYENGVAPATRTTQITIDSSGQLDLVPAYKNRVTEILDRAASRGLKVGLVPIWGVGYLHGRSTVNICSEPNAGPLQANNAFDWGQEVASAYGAHRALHYWVLGGDNFCQPSEDVNIWRNMAAGIRSTGANQKMTYHTAGWSARHHLFANEAWVDFLSPQTSHCIKASTTQAQLAELVNTYDKPVIASEMRYETIEPGWQCTEHGPGDPVLPQDVADDTNAALAAGVSGIVYGHNDRWAWGRGEGNGSPALGWTSVQASLNAPGELLMLDILGLPNSGQPPTTTPATVPPTQPPTTQPPTTTNTLGVIARGSTGQENITIEINGTPVANHTLTTTTRTYTYTTTNPIDPSTVRIAFTNDNGPRDTYIDAITINNTRYETEAPTTQSKGSWNGNCDTGYKQSEWLACNGWFHYGQREIGA